MMKQNQYDFQCNLQHSQHASFRFYDLRVSSMSSIHILIIERRDFWPNKVFITSTIGSMTAHGTH